MAAARYRRLLIAVIATLGASCTAACASAPVNNPANVAVGGPVDSMRVSAPNDAPPSIRAIRLSSNDVARGSRWSGQVLTTSNVASVEVRTNLFSIDVPRRAFGDFRFTADVLDVPPIFVRSYRLRVIARNSAGEATEEDLPLRIR